MAASHAVLLAETLQPAARARAAASRLQRYRQAAAAVALKWPSASGSASSAMHTSRLSARSAALYLGAPAANLPCSELAAEEARGGR